GAFNFVETTTETNVDEGHVHAVTTVLGGIIMFVCAAIGIPTNAYVLMRIVNKRLMWSRHPLVSQLVILGMFASSIQLGLMFVDMVGNPIKGYELKMWCRAKYFFLRTLWGTQMFSLAFIAVRRARIVCRTHSGPISNWPDFVGIILSWLCLVSFNIYIMGTDKEERNAAFELCFKGHVGISNESIERSDSVITTHFTSLYLGVALVVMATSYMVLLKHINNKVAPSVSSPHAVFIIHTPTYSSPSPEIATTLLETPNILTANFPRWHDSEILTESPIATGGVHISMSEIQEQSDDLFVIHETAENVSCSGAEESPERVNVNSPEEENNSRRTEEPVVDETENGRNVFAADHSNHQGLAGSGSSESSYQRKFTPSFRKRLDPSEYCNCNVRYSNSSGSSGLLTPRSYFSGSGSGSRSSTSSISQGKSTSRFSQRYSRGSNDSRWSFTTRASDLSVASEPVSAGVGFDSSLPPLR
ncbi:unnamed protein product, partial [Owenia fusiformis]